MKQKTFVIYAQSGAEKNQDALNALLEKGWNVVQVHPSTTTATWLVVAQESRYGAKDQAE